MVLPFFSFFALVLILLGVAKGAKKLAGGKSPPPDSRSVLTAPSLENLQQLVKTIHRRRGSLLPVRQKRLAKRSQQRNRLRKEFVARERDERDGQLCGGAVSEFSSAR